MTPDAERGRRDGADGIGATLPWGAVVLGGALTYVGAFLAVGALLFVDVGLTVDGGATESIAGPDGEDLFYVVGWVFYNAHFVDVVAGGGSVNLLAVLGGFSAVPTAAYHALPAASLVAAGWVLTRATEPDGTPGERAATGASVLAGYLPLAVVGSFVLTREAGTAAVTTTVGPDPATAILFAGIAYPVVFGGIGGYLAGRS